MTLALLAIATKLIDNLIPDPVAAAEAKLKAMELAQRGELAVLNAETQIAVGQAEINKIDAGSNSMFRAGWRPAAGWVCVLGLGVEFVLRPLLPWALSLFGKTFPSIPAMDMETLMGLLFALLGLGGYRAYEKVKGKA